MSELRILLVEDSAADAELAKVRLRGAGEVEHCASLAAALARLADPSRPRPSVVLLDLSLPDAYGLDALERTLRVQPPPVLVMSGDDDPASERAALARGARGFVRKGALSADELLRTIREAVRTESGA
jgi:DNA-binding NarL/FixJ family response regulator